MVEHRIPNQCPGFDPHRRHRVVSLSEAYLLQRVLVNSRKHWLRPDMTENLLTGTLKLKTNRFYDKVWY